MWSGDSTTTPEELAWAISDADIDVVCITDHSTVAGAMRLRSELPCRVVVGQEQRTPDGEVIGLFLNERIPPGCKTAEEAAREIRQQGGLVYAPHPADPFRHALSAATLERLHGEGLLDVIEVLNGKSSLGSLGEEAAELSSRLGIAAGAGSDAHVPEAIGAGYVEMENFEDSESFLAALRVARIVGHRFDPPRQWKQRVVPRLA